jgi:hypothetical protein
MPLIWEFELYSLGISEFVIIQGFCKMEIIFASKKQIVIQTIITKKSHLYRFAAPTYSIVGERCKVC